MQHSSEHCHAGRANAAAAAGVLAALEQKKKVGQAMQEREAQRAAQAKVLISVVFCH